MGGEQTNKQHVSDAVSPRFFLFFLQPRDGDDIALAPSERILFPLLLRRRAAPVVGGGERSAA